eukprot:6017354-Pyramimonas_sp.AAC.1
MMKGVPSPGRKSWSSIPSSSVIIVRIAPLMGCPPVQAPRATTAAMRTRRLVGSPPQQRRALPRRQQLGLTTAR